MNESYIKNVVEAAMLAAGRPLQVLELAELFDETNRPTVGEIRAALATLEQDFTGRGIELKETATGFRIQVRKDLANEVSRLWPERPPKYSRALLETMALIAYRQPITRAEIEAVRGVAVNPNIIKTLLERNWVRVVGQRDVPGRPELLGTTKDFLDYFGLRSLDELPPLAELKAMGDVNLQLDLSKNAVATDALDGEAGAVAAIGVAGAAVHTALSSDAAASASSDGEGAAVADAALGDIDLSDEDLSEITLTEVALTDVVLTDVVVAEVDVVGDVDLVGETAAPVDSDGDDVATVAAASDAGATEIADIADLDAFVEAESDAEADADADVDADDAEADADVEVVAARRLRAADPGANAEIDVDDAAGDAAGDAEVKARADADAEVDVEADAEITVEVAAYVPAAADEEFSVEAPAPAPEVVEAKRGPKRRAAEAFVAEIDADEAEGEGSGNDDDSSDDDELSADSEGSKELVASPPRYDD